MLLLRCDGDLAIAEVYAQQGALARRRWLDGDVLTYRWHGSRFYVRDESIVHDSFPYPPAFPTRASGDRILIDGLKVRGQA